MRVPALRLPAPGWRPIAVLATALAAISAVGWPAGPAGAAAANPTAAQAVRTGYAVTGQLAGVAATSAGNAWAVGFAGPENDAPGDKVLLVHWNGRAWSRVALKGISYGELTGITAVSARDAWAVGYVSNAKDTVNETLVLHWNGRTWARVAGLPISDAATAVTANGNQVWVAVHTLRFPVGFLHLAGGRWYILPVQSAASVPYLTAVAMVSPTQAWAGGFYLDKNANPRGYLLHWNGAYWKQVADPVPDMTIEGMASGPRGTAFAVGWDAETSATDAARSMRWNGRSWQAAPIPAANDAFSLDGVGFIPGGSAWAVGSTVDGTLTDHWTGRRWAEIASPNPGGANAYELTAVAATSAGNAWAVGWDEPQSNSDNPPDRTLIAHWNGKSWR